MTKMSYKSLVESIAALHRESAGRAALAVNQALVLRNWMIGAYLVEYQQAGKDRATYGGRLLERLSNDLSSRGMPGVSVQMLERARSFYLAYPQLAEKSSSAMRISERPRISSSAMRKSRCPTSGPAPLPPPLLLGLTWTHLIELLRLDDPWERAFYENECLKSRWSVRQLKRQIETLLYERTGLSTDKKGVLEAARRQASQARCDMADLIRDPYVLEFVGLTEKTRYAVPIPAPPRARAREARPGRARRRAAGETKRPATCESAGRIA